MPTVTIRDISDDVMKKIRTLSEKEKRSLNKEMLFILEEGLDAHLSGGAGKAVPSGLSPEVQIAVWSELCGKWDDKRSTEEIVEDIRKSRTMGREISL
ncbi:MAG: hypothetical protein C0404_03580 [Verrucomicrobia bacterium]|nr:hypothetical protein [Verrucomicrobiota bacterium]